MSQTAEYICTQIGCDKETAIVLENAIYAQPEKNSLILEVLIKLIKSGNLELGEVLILVKHGISLNYILHVAIHENKIRELIMNKKETNT